MTRTVNDLWLALAALKGHTFRPVSTRGCGLGKPPNGVGYVTPLGVTKNSNPCYSPDSVPARRRPRSGRHVDFGPGSTAGPAGPRHGATHLGDQRKHNANSQSTVFLCVETRR